MRRIKRCFNALFFSIIGMEFDHHHYYYHLFVFAILGEDVEKKKAANARDLQVSNSTLDCSRKYVCCFPNFFSACLSRIYILNSIFNGNALLPVSESPKLGREREEISHKTLFIGARRLEQSYTTGRDQVEQIVIVHELLLESRSDFSLGCCSIDDHLLCVILFPFPFTSNSNNKKNIAHWWVGKTRKLSLRVDQVEIELVEAKKKQRARDARNSMRRNTTRRRRWSISAEIAQGWWKTIFNGISSRSSLLALAARRLQNSSHIYNSRESCAPSDESQIRPGRAQWSAKK